MLQIKQSIDILRDSVFVLRIFGIFRNFMIFQDLLNFIIRLISSKSSKIESNNRLTNSNIYRVTSFDNDYFIGECKLYYIFQILNIPNSENSEWFDKNHCISAIVKHYF